MKCIVYGVKHNKMLISKEMNFMTNGFTKNLRGDIHPDFLKLAQKTEGKLKELIQEYVKECFENNIDSCSSDGFFLNIAAHELTMYRSKLLYEEYRRTGNKFDE